VVEEEKLNVVLIWHMHQPYYGIGDSPCLWMPWVRLHGTKDYLDMASILSEHPGVMVTFNFSPCLLQQIRMYVEEGATDRVFDLSMTDPRCLPEDIRRSLPRLLSILSPRLAYRFPRLKELLHRYGTGNGEGGTQLRDQDLLDLQILYNLAWFDPVYFSEDHGLRALKEKGRGYSLKDMDLVQARTRDILSKIIPLYRDLAGEGRIELSASPFHHPILPLLFDTDMAAEASPDALPPYRPFRSPDDVRRQISSAVAYHAEVFGEEPRGMWPSEGGLCRQLIPFFLQSGIRWAAGDETVLVRSLGDPEVKGPARESQPPLEVYHPYRLCSDDGFLSLFFRDHFISDKIAFSYCNMDIEDSIDHLKSYLMNVLESTCTAGIPYPVITIVVDGENPWENYDEDGRVFLHRIYDMLEDNQYLSPTTPSRYLDLLADNGVELPSLADLSPGSWIYGDFRIWIGGEESNRAWELLGETRDYLVGRCRDVDMDPGILERAWKEIYIAEGSDWFWWYGDDFSSEMDAEFDLLFRLHLIRVYELLGDEPPVRLFDAISPESKITRYCADSYQDFNVILDGEVSSYFEWLPAIRYYTCLDCQRAMNQPGIDSIYWGGGRGDINIRIDFRYREQLKASYYVVLCLVVPYKCALKISLNEGPSDITHSGRQIGRSYLGKVLEVCLDSESLGNTQGLEGKDFSFYVRFCDGKEILASYPAASLFEINRKTDGMAH
jgi:alpha-amylase/alpha-mannosidase (GH57 family)